LLLSLSSFPTRRSSDLGNMSPEYGATCGIFPVDEETLRYLRMTGRTDEQIALVEAYCKEQGLFHSRQSPEPVYSQVVELDLASRSEENTSELQSLANLV